MPWFDKIKSPRIQREKQGSKIPEGLWRKCDSCREVSYSKEIDQLGGICPLCGHHFLISAKRRIELLVDAASFEEQDATLSSKDPLHFRDTKRYRDRLKQAVKNLGIQEAVICGTAAIHARPIVIGAMEFGFLGGSMASVVGEKITRAIERAMELQRPVVLISCSGGARMQEGPLSLMQMAKTSAALARLGREGLPYISILTNPTTGGVTASFAMLGDVIIAEPQALIGFAGPRVIEQTIRQKLPEGFQRAEFLLKNGAVDMIVDRRELRDTVSRLLGVLTERPLRA